MVHMLQAPKKICSYTDGANFFCHSESDPLTEKKIKLKIAIFWFLLLKNGDCVHSPRI